MRKNTVPRGYWNNFDNCKNEAQKYKSNSEFRQNNGSAYEASRKNGWLQQITNYDNKKEIKPKNYWCYKTCFDEAQNFSSRNEFKIKSPAAYEKARKGSFLDSICQHMKPCGNYFNKFVYIFEFSDNHVYVGLTYDTKVRYNTHTNYHKTTSPVYKHIEKTNANFEFKILNETPIPNEEAQILEHNTIQEYLKNGWNILNKAKTGLGSSSLGNGHIKWTKERCLEYAATCSSKSEFQRKYPAARKAASQIDGFFEEITRHMEERKKPAGYWDNIENCLNEARKYKSRKEFNEKSQHVYEKSRLNGWLDFICEGMEYKCRPPGYWNDKEKCHQIALQFIYKPDFIKEYGGLVHFAKKMGWFLEITSHMIPKPRKNAKTSPN